MREADEALKLGRQVWLSSRYAGASVKPNKIVVKLTRDYNLRCTYCYVSGGARKEQITSELVERFFDQVAKNNPRVIDCTFHGGEPLMAGDVLKNIVHTLERKSYSARSNHCWSFLHSSTQLNLSVCSLSSNWAVVRFLGQSTTNG